MKITILAIDKLKKNAPEQALIADYIKKTRWTVEVREFEANRALPDIQKKQAESDLLLRAISPNAKVIVLDEGGKEVTSRQFAGHIRTWMDDGFDIVFLIGGADGHADSVKKRADMILSFGRMTMPHILARVVLVEQIYRAKTILDGHPYHRD